MDMGQLTQRMTAASQGAREAFRRAPVEVVTGWFLAACACYAIHDSGSGAGRVLARILFAAAPMLIAVFSVTTLHAFGVITQRARAGLTATYVAAAVIYGAWIFHPLRDAELWRWVLLTTAAAGGFSLLPFAIVRQRGAVRDMLWTFNARMSLHLTASFGFLGALMTGLFIGLISIEELLDLSIPQRTYGYLASLIMLGGGPWMAATALPQLQSDAPLLNPASRKLLASVCTWLVLPLTALYLVILYTYQLRVLLGGLDGAPSNVMSPLVLGASGLMLTGMLLAEQLRRGAQTSRGLFVRAVKGMPTLFLPLMPLSAWAIWIRVEQYGWTEFRYVRLLIIASLCVIFAASTWRWLTRRPQPLGTLFATFAVASLLASFGPWGAVDVAHSSQTARLRAALASEHEDLLGAQGRLRQDLPESITLELQTADQIDYLARHFGPEGFEGFTSRELQRELDADFTKQRMTSTSLFHALGWSKLDIDYRQGELTWLQLEATDLPRAPRSGALEQVWIYEHTEHALTRAAETLDAPDLAEVTITIEGTDVVLTRAGHDHRATLAPQLEYTLAAHAEEPRQSNLRRDVPEPLRRVELVDPFTGEALGALLLTHVQLRRDDERSGWELGHVGGTLLLYDDAR